MQKFRNGRRKGPAILKGRGEWKMRLVLQIEFFFKVFFLYNVFKNANEKVEGGWAFGLLASPLSPWRPTSLCSRLGPNILTHRSKIANGYGTTVLRAKPKCVQRQISTSLITSEAKLTLEIQLKNTLAIFNQTPFNKALGALLLVCSF